MASNQQTSSSPKTFCVWADDVRRVYQHVDAVSAKKAYELAKRQPECWQPCDCHDTNGYRLSNEVQDLESEEFVRIDGDTHCKTCGSEIVETSNNNNFNEGECGPCEYERYTLVPKLLAALQEAKEYVELMLDSSGEDNGESKMLTRWQRLTQNANGQAA
jgi:hypothetical protein